MLARRFALLAAAAALTTTGCPGRNPPRDAAADAPASDVANADAADPDARDGGPPVEQVRIAGAGAPVDVTIDRYGWPHIRGASLEDVARAQGYVMARQRFMQMEILRRNGNGTLAEILGSLSAQVIESDISVRVIGYRRTAQAIWDAMPDGETKRGFTAFAQGVNAYIADLRAERATLPRGSDFLDVAAIQDWTPVDSLVLIRLQHGAQSYSTSDIGRSAVWDRAVERFDNADPTANPARARRRGYILDVMRFAPSVDTTTLPVGGRGGGGGGLERPPVASRALAPRIPADLLASVAGFERGVHAAHAMLGVGPDVGSNVWGLAPAATGGRGTLLASDPHVTLPSPSLFWGCHLEVTGDRPLEAWGSALPGAPGILMGFTRRVAWGMTNANYDQTDVFLETITPGADGGPDTVRYMGRDVAIERITERIPTGSGQAVDVVLERVPHHGVLIPTVMNGRVVPRTSRSAFAVRWTGNEPSNEAEAIFRILRARDAGEARASLAAWGGPSLNFVFADVAGGVTFSTESYVPTRAPGALAFDPMTNPNGTLPCRVLPGDGSADWTGRAQPRSLPQGMTGPAQPFLVNANNDQNGNLLDDNPANDPVFLTCFHDPGFRAQRITQRLAEVNGRATPEDMEAIQGDHRVEYGARVRPFLAAAMARLAEERATPGRHADLTAIAEATSARAARLADAAGRLARWSLESPSGMDTEAAPAQRADAVAASLFHVFVFHLQSRAFADEARALEVGSGANILSLLFLLEHPEQARTRDPATGQSAIWDDLDTPARETRDAVLVAALDAAVRDLEARAMSPDMDTWLWGRFHTVTFAALVPVLAASLTIPGTRDARFPNGFPRHGGFFVVDSSSPIGLSNLAYNHGPGHRLVVALDATDGPRGRIALPGGQEANALSPHQRDEAELWRLNRTHPILRDADEIAAAAERRIRIAP